eukprot:3146815-Rhodomonas_salina.1
MGMGKHRQNAQACRERLEKVRKRGEAKGEEKRRKWLGCRRKETGRTRVSRHRKNGVTETVARLRD